MLQQRPYLPPTPPRSINSPTSSRCSSEGVALSEDELMHAHAASVGRTRSSPTDSTDSGGWDLQSEIASPAPVQHSTAGEGEEYDELRDALSASRLSPTIRDASTLFHSAPPEPSPHSHASIPTSPPLQSTASSSSSGGPFRFSSTDDGQARTDSPNPRRHSETAHEGGGGLRDGGMSTASVPPKPAGSPVRRFDPFSPLSPTPAFPFATPPTSSAPPRYVPPSARARSTSPVVTKSAPTTAASPFPSQSLARENRPSSLYLPLDETPPSRVDATGMTPTWPFVEGEHDIAYAQFPQPQSDAASTPSAIHPSYGEQPRSTSPKRSSKPGHSPLPGDDDRAGSFRRSSLTDYGEAPARRPSPNGPPPPPAQWSAITVNPSDVRRPNSITSSDGAAAAKLKFVAQGAAGQASRHGASFSMGTHALLSSRASPTSRLARQLDTPTAWLVLYFSFNLGLTLFNKLVLQGFPFPWTLTGIQMLSGTIGTQIALNRGFFTQARLTTREGIIMVAFSSLYTINIAVSNLSLHLVTVPVRFPFPVEGQCESGSRSADESRLGHHSSTSVCAR